MMFQAELLLRALVSKQRFYICPIRLRMRFWYFPVFQLSSHEIFTASIAFYSILATSSM